MTRTSRVTESTKDIWADLARDPAPVGLIKRRLHPDLRHDVYIGERRPTRERVLLLDIRGSAVGVPKHRPPSRGLEIKVESSGENGTAITLISSTGSADPMFSELVDDVVAVLLADPSEGAAGRIVQRVLAWQSFFSVRRTQFSEELAAGLFAELAVLKLHVIPALGAHAAMVAWCGPDPAVQDFQVGTVALEVKSSRGGGPGQLRVSSERQLDTVGLQRLYIALLRLDQRGDGTGATLQELAAEVGYMLEGTPAANLFFNDRLLAYGWHSSLADIRNERYHVLSSEAFEVVDDFPKIVAASLPLGVRDVSYSIDRNAIEAFQTGWDSVMADLKEQS